MKKIKGVNPSLKAELEKAAAKGKPTATAVFTAKEASHAALILTAADAAEKASASLFTTIRAAVTDGCSFEGLEAAVPALKDKGAYRSAKATIKGCVKNAIPLVSADGTPRSKGDLAKALSEKTQQPEGKGNGAGERPATQAEVVKGALAMLKASSKLRKQFGAQIVELAEILAAEATGTKKAA